MYLKKIFPFIILIFTALSLSSCAENLPQDIPQSYVSPTEFTFNTSYENAWKNVVRAVSTENIVRTLDKSSGLIVTEYDTVNKQTLTMFETTMFGRTYKNSYSVNIISESPGKVNIRVRSNLMMEQFAFYNRERSVSWFESYMRQHLFRKICESLYKNESKCERLFPDYNSGPPEDQLSDYSPSHGVEVANLVDTSAPSFIIDVQTMLTETGYNPGPIDGKMGAKTITAIKQYQTVNSIYASGKLDQPTLESLGF